MYMVACRLHMPFCMTLLPKRVLYYIVFDDYIISNESVNILFLATSFLYIPIMISVSKMSNLRSVRESQPQRYIFWQTMAMLISNLIHIPMYSYLLYHKYDIAHDLMYFASLDFVTTPVTMQVSYLGCNKKNLEVIFMYLRRKFGRVASVEPSRIERTTAAVQEN